MAPKSSSQAVVGEAIDGCIAEALQNGESLMLRVQGDCMLPVLQDQQRVKIYQQSSYLPGDIVAYYCPFQQKRLVHRVLGRVPVYVHVKEKRYLIMADNAKKPDLLVSAQKILGRVDIEIGQVKRPAYFFKGLYWFTVIAIRKVFSSKK